MDTIYLKIKVKKTDSSTEALRNEGLFFTSIAECLELDSAAIEEIEPAEFSRLAKNYQKKQQKNDQSRSGKRITKK